MKTTFAALAFTLCAVSAQAQEVAIPGFTVSVSASAPMVKSNTESFSRDVLANGEIEISTRTVTSIARQGRTTGVITVTVGDESASYPLTAGTQIVIPAVGSVRVVVTVTLSAFVGLGSASITVDDVYLTVR